MEPMCIQIINSNSPWYRSRRPFADGLLYDGWIDWFLKMYGFPLDLPRSAAVIESLKELRSLLTAAMNAVLAGEEPSSDAIAGLNRFLAGSPVHYVIRQEGGKHLLELSPQKCDWNYVYGEIAASFIKMFEDHDADRFKRCDNPDCLSVYYDGSRNRTRKWCCGTCSSLIKVRRFREKGKEQAGNG